MMRTLASQRSRWVALAASLLWAWSVLAGQVHGLRVVHFVCDDHRAVVEASSERQHAPRDAGVYAQQAEHGHDHGCPVQPLPSLPTPALPAVAWFGLRWVLASDPLPVAPPARGPPLEYAPKTSPPLVA